MRRIRVAVAQLEIVEGDCAGNWRRARAALERAASGGADLVVLPEMWHTGYAYRRLPLLAKDTPACLGKVAAIARRRGFFVAGSCAEAGEGERLHNTACIVGPDGAVRATYRKIHLFGPMKEDRYFAPGREVAVAHLEIGVVGLGLCYDLRFPELSRKLALRGAELLVFPSQWPAERLAHFHTLLAARAIENQLFVLGANRAGRSAAFEFGGGSMLVGPRGEIVAQLGAEPGFLEAEIDLDEVAATRARVSYLDDRAREVDEFLCR